MNKDLFGTPKRGERRFPIVVVEWAEVERGWGQRPDGYSLHLNTEHMKKYITAYTADRTGPAPDEYDLPGHPQIVDVPEAIYNYLTEMDGNTRSYENSLERVFAKLMKPKSTKFELGVVIDACGLSPSELVKRVQDTLAQSISFKVQRVGVIKELE